MKTQVECEWLSDHLQDQNVKVIDASWALDGTDMFTHYKHEHIEGAAFFDIEEISDKSIDLPHMAPNPKQFSKAVGEMGIRNEDRVIIYDQFGLFSAARVWWTFRLMGHEEVYVLKGGLPAWKAAHYPTQSHAVLNTHVNYIPRLNGKIIININQLRQIYDKENVIILDARPALRFSGKAPEPRPGLRLGHIPNSLSLPALSLIANGALRGQIELEEIFSAYPIRRETHIITTCGSGITAAILSMALEECGFRHHSLYDGSWAQWGRDDAETVAVCD